MMSPPTATLQINTYVGSKVSRLQAGYVERQPKALGDLAALRQAGFSDAGADPRIWNLVFEDLPEALQEARDPQASRAERAIQTALVLFATHQQSQTERTHRPGVPFGGAVGQLARARAGDGNSMDASVLARFQAAAMAQTHDARALLLRQLIAMMRSAKSLTIGFDYGGLAADLFLFQLPGRAPDVRRTWGRALHRLPTTTSTNSTDSAPTPQEN